MIQEQQLRLLPHQAASEHNIIAYLNNTGVSDICAVRVLKRSIDARRRQVMVNLTVRIYINELPQDDAYDTIIYGDVSEAPQVIVVGAGPAGLFASLRLIEAGFRPILIERGKDVHARRRDIAMISREHRIDPESNYGFGEGGAGAFSDGKLSLYNEEDDDIYVGGVLHKYIGVEETKRLIDYTDKIYLEFGADTKLEGVDYKEEVKKIYDKARKEDINLVNIPIRHLGTEKSHELYGRIEKYLIDNGIDILFDTTVSDLIVEKNNIKGVKIWKVV